MPRHHIKNRFITAAYPGPAETAPMSVAAVSDTKKLTARRRLDKLPRHSGQRMGSPLALETGWPSARMAVSALASPQ